MGANRIAATVVVLMCVEFLAGCNTLVGVEEPEFRKAAESFLVQPVSEKVRAELGEGGVKICMGEVIPYDTSEWVKGLEQGTAPPITKDFRWIKFFPVGRGENEFYPNAKIRGAFRRLLEQVGEVVSTCYDPAIVRANVRVGTAFKKKGVQLLLVNFSLDFWYKGEMFLDVGRDWDTTWEGPVDSAALERVLDRKLRWLAIETKIKWRKVIGPDPTKR